MKDMLRDFLAQFLIELYYSEASAKVYAAKPMKAVMVV